MSRGSRVKGCYEPGGHEKEVPERIRETVALVLVPKAAADPEAVQFAQPSRNRVSSGSSTSEVQRKCQLLYAEGPGTALSLESTLVEFIHRSKWKILLQEVQDQAPGTVVVTGCNVLSQSLANPQPLLATHDGTAQDGHATEFTRRFRSRSRLAKKQESRWSDSANDAPDEICECIAESLPSNKTLIMRKIARI
ncbi:hypothetical protein pipiens_003864 [Culex pipiens pipiens]|uniref:Uncharacterized protein n=1 Tax=Culex pipiens pipiens TaxID=38569 RepID=A0ABD1CRW7_CULPP